MSKTLTDHKLAIEEIQRIEHHVVEPHLERSGLWPIELFNERGKWKYTAYLLIERPQYWVEFLPWINGAMNATPPAVRGVTFHVIPEGWHGVMASSPLGYPILVKGVDNGDITRGDREEQDPSDPEA